MASRPHPMDIVKIRWCRRCGRNDFRSPLRERGRHWKDGKICTGRVLTIEYMRATIWSSEWEDRE